MALTQDLEENNSEDHKLSRYDGTAIALGAVGAVFVLYFIINGILPFLPVAAIFILLFPFRQYKAARAILFTVGSVFIFWLLITLSGILFPFIVGLLIAYIFNPYETLLKQKWKI